MTARSIVDHCAHPKVPTIDIGTNNSGHQEMMTHFGIPNGELIAATQPSSICYAPCYAIAPINALGVHFTIQKKHRFGLFFKKLIIKKEIVMDKYTKILIMAIKIPVGIFCILTGLGLIGVSVWVSTFSDIASMILLIALLGGGALINYGLGYAFLGDEYKSTSYVRSGNTTFTPVETERFLIRRKFVMIIGFISYALLSVYYVARVILSSIYAGLLKDMDFNTNIAALIIFAVISLFVAFCLFLLYKRTKHIDLKEE